MKAIEFESELQGETLHVPAAVAEQLTEGRKTRVIHAPAGCYRTRVPCSATVG